MDKAIRTKIKTNAQQVFCIRRAEVQNSTAVFRLNISNNIGFCSSIFPLERKAPNRWAQSHPVNDHRHQKIRLQDRTFTRI